VAETAATTRKINKLENVHCVRDAVVAGPADATAGRCHCAHRFIRQCADLRSAVIPTVACRLSRMRKRAGSHARERTSRQVEHQRKRLYFASPIRKQCFRDSGLLRCSGLPTRTPDGERFANRKKTSSISMSTFVPSKLANSLRTEASHSPLGSARSAPFRDIVRYSSSLAAR
jgi:hypothetical protein